MESNTSQLWNTIWEKPTSEEEDNFALVKEENGIRWARIEKIILKEFESFNNLEVIEIGAGSGVYGALMAKRGAKVTILDYSEFALNRARELFERKGLSAEYIQYNALSLPEQFFNRFNVSMSFGLAEHFKGEDRIKIHNVHFDVLKKRGYCFYLCTKQI